MVFTLPFGKKIQNKLLKVPRQRLTALFFCALFACSIALPPASVFANEQAALSKQQRADKSMSKDYPGPLKTPDANAGSDLTDLFATNAASNERVQGASKPEIKAGEVKDKRTATSSTTVNEQGQVTKKQFFTPKFYKQDNEWKDIKTNLIEDKNAGDAGNPFGWALGQAQSWVTKTDTYKVEANDWQTRFAASNDDVGMVRLQFEDQTVALRPVGAAVVVPRIKTQHGVQTVMYDNLWPGIDVEYQVTGSSLKEFVILKNRDAQTNYGFTVDGAGLEADPEVQGGYRLKGALADDFSISPLSVSLQKRGFIKEPVVQQSLDNNRLNVTVDQEWLQNLPQQNFPVAIDPTFSKDFGWGSESNHTSHRDDSYSCTVSTCFPQAGTTTDGYWWRSTFQIPYTDLAGKTLVSANLHLAMLPNNGNYHGTYSNKSFEVFHATDDCFGCINTSTGAPVSPNTTVGSTGDIDVTDIYDYLIAQSNWAGRLLLTGEENTTPTETLKMFDPNSTYVTFTTAPIAPTITSPTPHQVFVDPQVSFKVNTITSSSPQEYAFCVSGGPDGTGTVICSNMSQATQWTIPDGILQDGGTYYVRAQSREPLIGGLNGYSDFSAAVPFRVDMRTGKDKTQAYDTLGPVDVDLATGNLATTAASHTSSALGGSLGINLDYNSPVRSRNGLNASYYNNTSWSGSPVMTRVDSNIEFSWGTGSPASGVVNNDSFSAKWEGYFVAPVTDSYYFGGVNDDSMTVKINSTTMYNSSGCFPSDCYGGSSVSLTAGQVVPIEVTYIENTGGAQAHLKVRRTGLDATAPTTWLRTGVRPVGQQRGLIGHYFKDDGSHDFGDADNVLFMQRTDPIISFDWGTGAPFPGGSTDNFLVRWTGFVTVPTTGSYELGAASDDGVRIKLGAGGGETTVLTAWANQTATDRWGSSYSFTGGTAVPITVEYYEQGGQSKMELKIRTTSGSDAQIIPAAWMAPKSEVLPAGWSLGIDPDGNLGYDRLRVTQNSAILTDSSGSTHEYTYTTGNAYKPPVNEYGQLVRNADGSFTLQDVDGRTYVFAATGLLSSVTSPVDDRKPAALQYTYTGTPAKIEQITDAVDTNRWAKVYYGGDTECGSTPSGYDAAPTGFLCALETNDGRATYFYYDDGYLSRIAQPGNVYTDYQYDSNGRIISIRDALANDAIAAAVRTENATVLTEIGYDTVGRVSSVKQPGATASATRLEHTIEYLPGTPTYVNGTPSSGYFGATQQHVAGATEPNGFSRRIEYDHLLRTTEETDIANLATVTEWDNVGFKDLIFSTVDPTDLKTTTLYDDEDRVSHNYGPAPSSYFETTRVPSSTYLSQVPHTESKYDESLVGPSVAWYNAKNASLFGAPKLHTTGLTPSNPGLMNRNFSSDTLPFTVDSGMDGFGTSATGVIRFPGTGTYTFSLVHDDSVRLWIDDALILNGWDYWSDTTKVDAATFSATANKAYRFRLDYAGGGTHIGYDAWLKGPSITNVDPTYGVHDWTPYVKPGYNLPTSAKVYDSTIGDVTSTTNYGSTPELSLAEGTTIDPSGLNLTTSAAYETQGATGSFLRQTSKTLPGGGTTAYAYYTATETKDNPCTTGTTEAYKQAGFMKTKTEADPDAGGSQTGRVSESIYDDAGRVVASRYNADDWTCTTYDSRGRVTEVAIPAFNGAPARTVNHDYDFDADPLVSAHWDATGWIVVWTDLLGRTVRYGDVHDQDTYYEYDTLGRLLEKDGPLGVEAFTYDNYHRLTAQKLDTVTIATPHYDSYSRIDYVEYPTAGQQKLTLSRDSLGRLSGHSYTLGNGSTGPSDSVTRSQSGQIISGTELGQSKSYTYDKAGRLTAATIGSSSYAYSFGTPTGCSGTYNSNSGKNSNRSSQTINSVTTSFCYDYADRLISSSNALYNTPTYDAHGNTTQMGTGSVVTQFGYDSSDRNMSITEGAKSTAYERDVTGRITKRTVAEPSTPALPTPWLSTNIGGQTGTGSESSGTFTLASNAYDIWETDDQLQFTSQTLVGNGTIIARVTSQTDTADWAKAGLIIKESLTEDSDYAAVMVTPDNGVRMQYNYYDDIDGGSYSLPNAWLKLTRSGNTITTYKSSNGSSWTQVGSETVALPNTTQIGLFALSGDTGETSTAVFDNVSITPTTSSTLPSGWSSGDVGNPGVTGSASHSSGTYTLTGAGYDVWGADDQFQYAYKTLSGNGEIVARVTSQTDTNEWAKAGIVIKASPSEGTNYASVYTSPDHGIRMNWNYDQDVDGGSYSFPNTWLKLVRNGNTITTYKSSNGTSWTQVGTASVTLPSTAVIGLYVSSVNDSTASTATFDNVTITQNSTTSTDYKYSYTNDGDSPDTLLNSSGTILERYIQLPGGVLLTKRASSSVFSLPNVHGDVMATTDAGGASLATFTYDPFGNATTNPNNTATGATFGWVGQHEKTTETALTLQPIQMGTRVYLPALGRFAQVDPIEGGTPNRFVYPPDPIGDFDLDGTVCWRPSPDARDFLSCRYNDDLESKTRTTVNWMKNAAIVGLGVTGAAATGMACSAAPGVCGAIAARAAASLKNTRVKVHLDLKYDHYWIVNGKKMWYQHIQVEVYQKGSKGSGKTPIRIRFGKGCERKHCR
jgi:RHS repeat-associated protein